MVSCGRRGPLPPAPSTRSAGEGEPFGAAESAARVADIGGG
ncbi:hypothetical protein FHS01_003986 [Longimicrobium terrae]|uniref:Uncharacterized protein n=1 Tax=Longimicrobium terrae TaxID=1639882 RepID=A0A841H2G8_9BACT|nr:hypothetical protein [Longimicrobium terrae]MBB6072174.1 hypothetical protein [Longimicrobium terrae]